MSWNPKKLPEQGWSCVDAMQMEGTKGVCAFCGRPVTTMFKLIHPLGDEVWVNAECADRLTDCLGTASGWVNKLKRETPKE